MDNISDHYHTLALRGPCLAMIRIINHAQGFATMVATSPVDLGLARYFP